jgi:YD repeat-containing protein
MGSAAAGLDRLPVPAEIWLERAESITYPSGKTVSLTYDAAGQVTGLSSGRSALIGSVVYQPFGPAAAWRQGNGANLVRSFDLDGRIVSINAGGATLNYGYDAASRITASDESGWPNQSFGYDALDRLTGYVERGEYWLQL